MSYQDLFVGTLAIVIGIGALLAGVGPWAAPYQLRTMAAVTRRYGKPAARSLWIVVAFASLIAGAAISAGVRPSYASPTQQPTAR
ncbi:hypothetical protein [Stieleria varia]|uniref:Uncharacterized protein n=1 Tax=Stieleria varia TaxID=2528005 RepID=A0A5C6AYL6_9BACT|nr:hypothetical protein [Stieleria varia]TWU04511.1 hypothetical protein Pla52n_25520 [Stieleria varia]